MFFSPSISHLIRPNVNVNVNQNISPSACSIAIASACTCAVGKFKFWIFSQGKMAPKGVFEKNGL